MHGPSPQLLALCAFLALCAVGIPVHWWPRWVAVVIAGRSQPEWATDPWIRRWIAEQELKQRTTALPVPEGSLGECQGGHCSVRRWLPRRLRSARRQLVPFVIWQTWKDTEPRPLRFEGLNSIVQMNPEYDYALFTDEDCARFMCEFADPDTLRAFEIIVPGAAKADIWRLAIIWQYGGIYVDSDVKALHPFREYLWPNASVASGIGRAKDFHQWLLLYTPRHPFIRQALKAVTQNVLSNFTERSGSQRTAGIIRMTGPSGYHEGGVIPLLEGNGCTVDNDTATAKGLQFVHEGHPCEQMLYPEPIGIVQVYDRDYLSGAVAFKVAGLGPDALAHGVQRYTDFDTWATMFTNSDSSMCQGRH